MNLGKMEKLIPDIKDLLLRAGADDANRVEIAKVQLKLDETLKLLEGWYFKIGRQGLASVGRKKVEGIYKDINELYVLYDSVLDKIEKRANAGEDIMVPDAFEGTSDIFERVYHQSESTYNQVVNDAKLASARAVRVLKGIGLGAVILGLGATTFFAIDYAKDAEYAYVLQLNENENLRNRIKELEERDKNGTITQEELEELYELRARVIELESEKKELSDENKELKNENERLKDLENTIEKLKKNLEDSEKLVKELRELLEKDPNNSDLKTQLADALADVSRLSSELNSLKIDYANLQEEKDGWKTKFENLEKEYDKLSERNDILEEKNENLTYRNDELEKTIKSLNVDIEDLKDMLDDAGVEIGDLTLQLKNAKETIKELQDLIASGSLTDAERKNYEDIIARLNGQVAEINGKLDEKTKQCDDLLKQLAEAVAEKEDAISQCKDYEKLVYNIDRMYIDIMGHSGMNLSPSDKLIAIVTYYMNNEPTSDDLIKLSYVYEVLDEIEFNGSDYAGMTPDEFKALLEKIVGGLLADSSDGPTHGAVNEGDGSQPGNNGNGNGSGTGSKEENGDTAERLPGDN